jgi:RNA polymerase sigma-70 factor (ECF subfamily)
MTGPDFREFQPRIVATLVRKFGPRHLDEILDAAQESIASLISTQEFIRDPLAWATLVSQRRVIDRLRQKSKQEPLTQEPTQPDIPDPHDELRLIFLCCHPKLKPVEQICLILRVWAGIPSPDIAALLHESEDAVQQRITRSKTKLSPADFNRPPDPQNVPTVLQALYLIFTEGYESRRGPDHINPKLAFESLRLAEQLAELIQSPELHALLALMHFNISRLPARATESGELILLPNQDRTLYNQSHISAGFHHLTLAQSGESLTRYHIEAGLAASISAGAPAKEVLYWHDLLVQHYPTPLAKLSQAIAIGQVHGPQAALDSIRILKSDPHIAATPHYHAALGTFYAELGNRPMAAKCYRRAVALTMSAPTRASLELRAAELTAQPEQSPHPESQPYPPPPTFDPADSPAHR